MGRKSQAGETSVTTTNHSHAGLPRGKTGTTPGRSPTPDRPQRDRAGGRGGPDAARRNAVQSQAGPSRTRKLRAAPAAAPGQTSRSEVALVIDLSGRVVIVTGGNSGIGLGIARGVARAGASVAIWSRRAERNAEAVAELEALGATAIGIQCDVSDEGNVAAAMRATLGRFGRLDCLVANAGTAGKQSFTDMSLNEWHRVLQVNLDGAFLCLREAARVLVGQGQGGSLVGVSSTSAIDGAPGQQHYAASKTALLAVIRALAVELARHKVRCNSLLPGWTDTELLAEAKTHEKFVNATIQRTPARRWATLHDFETVGAFLADPSLIFHTGDSMVVDGGYTIF